MKMKDEHELGNWCPFAKVVLQTPLLRARSLLLQSVAAKWRALGWRQVRTPSCRTEQWGRLQGCVIWRGQNALNLKNKIFLFKQLNLKYHKQ